MKMIKRAFEGKNDEKRIVMTNLFPFSDIVVSTPLDPIRKQSVVVIEGNEIQVEALYKSLLSLIKCSLDENYFGAWTGVAPHEQTEDNQIGWKIFYDSRDNIKNKIQILNLVLRTHFIKICNLRLCPISEISVFNKEGILLKQNVNLPQSIGNGEIDLPIIDERPLIIM